MKKCMQVVLFFVFILVCGVHVASAVTESGYLSGSGASYTFTVNAGSVSPVDLIFNYPMGSVDFWVKVVGRDGYTVLNTFDLDKTDIIQLFGGGTFYLTIYSKKGSGEWSAKYEIKEVLSSPASADAKKIRWEDVDETEIIQDINGNRVRLSGHIDGEDDCDVIYLVSDSSEFEVVFEKVSGSALFAELYEGNGKTSLGTYKLSKVKRLCPNISGGFFIKLFSNGGAGDYVLTYLRKDEFLVAFKNRMIVENTSHTARASKVELWVPVIETFEPYQEVLKSSTSVEYRKIVTDNLGNRYFYFVFDNFAPKKTVTIDMDYTILLKSNYSVPEECMGEVIDEFLKPEPLIESNNKFVRELAHEITQNDTTICEKEESIYRYVLENITYKVQDHMVGGAKALETKVGDCNEFTDAILALSRASGIPARKGNGYIFFGKDDFVSHAFSEVYLPGAGWTVVDATMHNYIVRPPIYIYAYFGENPSIFREPDIEDSYYYYYWDGPNAPTIETEQVFFGNVIEK